MNKPVLLGVLLLGAAGYAAASCKSEDNTTPSTGTGGQLSGSGGSTASGAQAATGGSGPGTGGTLACGTGTAGNVAQTDADGGLVTIGHTDPKQSVPLQAGGHLVMDSKYQGYCFTYVDKGGSALYPPCGTTGPCFTQATGLCLTANLGPGSATTWGGGFGCSLNQLPEGGDLNTDVAGKTSLTIGVYGCSVPEELQVQLNVMNPPTDDAGVPGSGYFCNRAKLGSPDANGVRSVTVQLADLRQDCWLTGGPMLNAATAIVRSIQAQVNAIDGNATQWDFCVAKLSID